MQMNGLKVSAPDSPSVRPGIRRASKESLLPATLARPSKDALAVPRPAAPLGGSPGGSPLMRPSVMPGGSPLPPTTLRRPSKEEQPRRPSKEPVDAEARAIATDMLIAQLGADADDATLAEFMLRLDLREFVPLLDDEALTLDDLRECSARELKVRPAQPHKASHARRTLACRPAPASASSPPCTRSSCWRSRISLRGQIFSKVHAMSEVGLCAAPPVPSPSQADFQAAAAKVKSFTKKPSNDEVCSRDALDH